MIINVVKRNGKKEPLMLEKWQAQVAKVCNGIADVSPSMIEIKSQLHFYDGITTSQIDNITLRAIVDLIDVESNSDVGHTNYQYVAGKQRMSMLRKDVYGHYEVPHLYEIVKKNVATGLYTKELLEWYTEEDWNKMNDILDHSKDELYSYAEDQFGDAGSAPDEDDNYDDSRDVYDDQYPDMAEGDLFEAKEDEESDTEDVIVAEPGEEEVPAEDVAVDVTDSDTQVDVNMDGVPDVDTGSPEAKKAFTSLVDTYNDAKQLGDPKLTQMIANALTYYNKNIILKAGQPQA